MLKNETLTSGIVNKANFHLCFIASDMGGFTNHTANVMTNAKKK